MSSPENEDLTQPLPVAPAEDAPDINDLIGAEVDDSWLDEDGDE